MSAGLPQVEQLPLLGDRLAESDVALLNLAAAQGLPETEHIDTDACLDKLDDWAQGVQVEILRHLYRFNPEQNGEPDEFHYGSSLGRFFCWYLLQVLQEDCGVVYHSERKFDPDFCEPQDVFIHGIVAGNGKGGTCASMPVVYVAVARRLGLPVYLVETKGHLFFRWDDPTGTLIEWSTPGFSIWVPPDRFNIEGSGEGIAYYADSHYIQWPELLTVADIESGAYLKCRTPEQDLAAFLIQRAECFHELGNETETLKAIHYARQLDPEDSRFEWLHAQRTKPLLDREESLGRMQEQHLQSSAGRAGHALTCACRQCQEIRRMRQIQPTGHSQSCRCKQCRDVREQLEQCHYLPGHSPSCQCHHCNLEREQMAPQSRLPGHGLSCRCAACYGASPLAGTAISLQTRMTQRYGAIPSLPPSHAHTSHQQRLGIPQNLPLPNETSKE